MDLVDRMDRRALACVDHQTVDSSMVQMVHLHHAGLGSIRHLVLALVSSMDLREDSVVDLHLARLAVATSRQVHQVDLVDLSHLVRPAQTTPTSSAGQAVLPGQMGSADQVLVLTAATAVRRRMAEITVLLPTVATSALQVPVVLMETLADHRAARHHRMASSVARPRPVRLVQAGSMGRRMEDHPGQVATSVVRPALEETLTVRLVEATSMVRLLETTMGHLGATTVHLATSMVHLNQGLAAHRQVRQGMATSRHAAHRQDN